MNTENNYNSFPTALFEELLNRSSLDAGMTPDELKQAEIIAEIEVKLVATGRSIKNIYAEWQESTSEQIIDRYGHLLAVPTAQTHDISSVDTGWLDAVFVNCVRKEVYYATFQVQIDQRNSQPLQGEIKVAVTGLLAKRIKVLHTGQRTKIRLSACLSDGELTAALVDIEIHDAASASAPLSA